jgi:hypothetical protein
VLVIFWGNGEITIKKSFRELKLSPALFYNDLIMFREESPSALSEGRMFPTWLRLLRRSLNMKSCVLKESLEGTL